MWRPTVTGLENVPATGGAILASNHLSFADSVVIPCVVPRKVVFLAKSDYFTGTGIKGALMRGWFEGRLYRGRTGVAHLALTAGVPVVPVGLQGTEKLQPVGSNLPRIVPVSVRFGEPIDFTGRYDGVPSGRARREATDEIMTAIQRLSGQPAAGVYNERPVEA